MNKRIAILVVLSLLAGVMIPLVVYGEEQEYDLEELALKAKQIFEIPDDYDTFNSSISSYGERTYYYFNWRDSARKLNDISVTIDSNGLVTSYSTYDPKAPEEQRLPRVTKDEAINLAVSFIERLGNGISNSIEYDDTNYYAAASDPNYNLRFIRTADGIPFIDNDLNISISKGSGKTTSLYLNWTGDAEFSGLDGIMDLESARNAYKKIPGLQLVYKISDQFPRPLDSSGQELSHYLVYAPRDNITMIDPWTGEPVISGYGPYGMGGGKAEAMDQGGITPVEKEELEKLKGLLSSAEADKKSRDLLDIGDDYLMDSQSLYPSWKNKNDYNWSTSFSKNSGAENSIFIEVSIDARSGELISLYINNSANEGKKPTLGREKAREIAEDFVRKTIPNLMDSIRSPIEYNISEAERLQYFIFNRYIGDIQVEGDSITVVVDTFDGSIASYNKSWYSGSFPLSEGIITLDEAYKALIESVGFGLGYRIIPVEEKGIWSDLVRLVYQTNPQRAPYIDPFTGEPLDYSGNPYRTRQAISYGDLDNTYAKDKIMILTEYGITLPGENFMPKSQIIQKDFMRYLWAAMNSYRLDREVSDDTIYQELTDSGIIRDDEINREGKITKAEAAKFVVRAKGYEKIALIQGIYANIFEDSNAIDKDYKGYVTLAYGLGILKGDNSGYIRADYFLKREDAASIIFEFAFNGS